MKLAASLIAVFVVACGGTAPAAEPTAPTPSPTPTPLTISAECAEALRPLLGALEDLDARLNVGLNRNQYGDRVGDVSVAYNRLDASQLAAVGPTCIQTGVLLEDAFNEYVTANNVWGECLRRTSCDMDTVRPTLQHHWAQAGDKIREARQRWP